MNHFLNAVLISGLAFVAAGSAGASEDTSAVLSQATPHDRLLSLAFSGDSGIAVGEAGRVMISQDGGKTWKGEQAPTDLELMSVATNGKRTIAIGQAGLILVRDGTGQWKKVESGTTERLLQVDINKDGLAFVVGAFGVLLKSTDGGDSWKSEPPTWGVLYKAAVKDLPKADVQSDTSMAMPVDEPTNYLVKVTNDGAVIIGGEYGAILRSNDAGSTWKMVYRAEPVPGKVPPTFFGMRIRDDGTGFAVGQSGLVLETTDAGKTWVERKTPVQASLFGVESFPGGEVVVVGMRVGLHSHDDGKTWETMPALDLRLNWYSDVAHSASSPPGEFTAVGHSGRIVRLVP